MGELLEFPGGYRSPPTLRERLTECLYEEVTDVVTHSHLTALQESWVTRTSLAEVAGYSKQWIKKMERYGPVPPHEKFRGCATYNAQQLVFATYGVLVAMIEKDFRSESLAVLCASNCARAIAHCVRRGEYEKILWIYRDYLEHRP